MLIGCRRCNRASREPLSMMSGLAEPRAFQVGDSGPAVERQPWLGRLRILDLPDIGLTEIMHADAKQAHWTPAGLGPRAPPPPALRCRARGASAPSPGRQPITRRLAIPGGNVPRDRAVSR